MVKSQYFGCGDDELGGKLMAAFFRKIWASATKPEAVIFFNSGVKLLLEGSPVLDSLLAIRESGVDLVACGLCVQHFDVKDRIEVGRVSDMQEMVSILMGAEKVIST
jgi:hypothetical protein